MLAELVKRLDRSIGLTTDTERQRAVMVEKMAAITPRMPWLYAILVVNLSGLLISLKESMTPLTWAGVAILLVLAGRLVQWWRLGTRAPTRESAVRELRRVFVIGLVVCTAYCAWMLAIYIQLPDEDRSHLVLFGSMASLGCSFALTPMPSAARLPLFILSLPLAILLVAGGDAPHIAMGMTLMTLIFVAVKLVDAQNLSLTRLVYARLDGETEKQRAEFAEKSAIAERSMARKLADTDFLTGLANRRALLAAIDWHSRHGRGPVAVALLDLDGFKPINDTFGHVTGDDLLVEVGRRLKQLVGPAGMVARLGGDEFALLLYAFSEAGARELVAEAIENIAHPHPHEGRNLIVSACAGIACAEGGGTDPTQTIRMADIALFTAKRRGRGQVEVFSTSLEKNAKRRAEIELALRAPGVEHQIEVAFQPILDLATMEVCSFEALARWRHSDLGWIAPAEFIPITEQISIVQPISEALLRRAAAEAARWPDRIMLSFNLSAVHLCSDGSAQQIISLIKEAGLEPRRLQIEVTETALLADFDAARRNLAHLRSRGVRLVLDDFGAGYASISYLREMQFDAIKLDGSLLTAAASDRGGLPLLKGVLDLCGAVGLPCIAEHVETEDQVAVLRTLGCRYGQGYWLARPMSAESARQVARGEIIPFAPVLALKKLAG